MLPGKIHDNPDLIALFEPGLIDQHGKIRVDDALRGKKTAAEVISEPFLFLVDINGIKMPFGGYRFHFTGKVFIKIYIVFRIVSQEGFLHQYLKRLYKIMREILGLDASYRTAENHKE
jgi:hypothetical protein